MGEKKIPGLRSSIMYCKEYIIGGMWKMADLDKVTVGDCIDNHRHKGVAVLVNDGKVTGFKKENSTTANQSK